MLRHRRHNRVLINKTSRLADSDFIIRMIYKDMYQFVSFLYLSLCYFAFWQSLINEYHDDDDDDGVLGPFLTDASDRVARQNTLTSFLTFITDS